MNELDRSGLVERAKAITLRPDETWPVVAAEHSSPGEIITRYAIPLAAIGPVAGLIGEQLFGVGMVFAHYKPSLLSSVITAIGGYIMALAGLIVVALVADYLAPRFDGQPNRTQAFKLVAYAMTPGWIAGMLGLFPALAILILIASLYGIYLFYKGAGPLMKVPEPKVGTFTALTVLGAFLVNLVLAALLTAVVSQIGVGAAMLTDAEETTEITVPGVGTIDSAKMEDAARQLEGLASGQPAKPVDASAIQALLPNAIGGFQRESAESAGIGGIGSTVRATYRNGDQQVQVQIVDIAGLGAVAGALGGLGVEQNREDANGYERTRTVNGVIQTEKWDNKASRGEFGTQVAGRFMVKAEGNTASIDELRAIVAGVDQARLAQLAN